MKLSKLEQETIINYNQEEKTANIFTYDPALIRKLDKLCAVSPAITVEKRDGNCAEYNIPKKWIKVQMPRSLSDEQREKLKETALRNLRGAG